MKPFISQGDIWLAPVAKSEVASQRSEVNWPISDVRSPLRALRLRGGTPTSGGAVTRGYAGAFTASALAVLLLGGCSEKQSTEVLAKVGPREIRVADLQREAERRQNLRRAVPAKEALLQEMIQQEALVQRAKRAGLDQDPQLAREIDNLLIGKLIERELTKQIEAVNITPEEIRADYESNLAHYTQPAKVRLAILFLEASAKSSEAKRNETRERLTEARRRFLEVRGRKSEFRSRSSDLQPSNPGFGVLAVDFSDDQASRYRGGDIGWIEAGNFAARWPKAVLEAGCALATNQLSEIIETDLGCYLVLKTDARPGSVKPLEKIEAELRQSVLLKKRRDLDAAFRQEALGLAGVTLYTNALQAVVLPAANTALAKNGDAGPPNFPMLKSEVSGQKSEVGRPTSDPRPLTAPFTQKSNSP